jgi:hypothetical protein
MMTRASTIFTLMGPLTMGLALLAAGCDQDLSREYTFVVRVSAEPGRPLAGAQLSLKGKALGVSDADGSVNVRVRGHEGDVLPIEITCPAGHRTPAPVLVPLRRMGRDAEGHAVEPEFTAACAPLARSVVIAVRAENGPNLPLYYLGRELARTDASGAAHALLDVASEDVLELTLDTTEQPQLRPRSPVLRVQPGPGDEIAALTQNFSVEPRARVKKVPVQRGPVRIE